MNKRIAWMLAAIVATSAATGFAQSVPEDETASTFVSTPAAPPLPFPPPEPLTVNPPPAPRTVTVGPCDPSGCWGADGTRYDRVGGNTLIGTDGKMCQFVGGGLPLACP